MKKVPIFKKYPSLGLIARKRTQAHLPPPASRPDMMRCQVEILDSDGYRMRVTTYASALLLEDQAPSRLMADFASSYARRFVRKVATPSERRTQEEVAQVLAKDQNGRYLNTWEKPKDAAADIVTVGIKCFGHPLGQPLYQWSGPPAAEPDTRRY